MKAICLGAPLYQPGVSAKPPNNTFPVLPRFLLRFDYDYLETRFNHADIERFSDRRKQCRRQSAKFEIRLKIKNLVFILSFPFRRRQCRRRVPNWMFGTNYAHNYGINWSTVQISVPLCINRVCLQFLPMKHFIVSVLPSRALRQRPPRSLRLYRSRV